MGCKASRDIACYQKARERQEDIYTGKASVKVRYSKVEKKDSHESHCSEAIEVWEIGGSCHGLTCVSRKDAELADDKLGGLTTKADMQKMGTMR